MSVSGSSYARYLAPGHWPVGARTSRNRGGGGGSRDRENCVTRARARAIIIVIGEEKKHLYPRQSLASSSLRRLAFVRARHTCKRRARLGSPALRCAKFARFVLHHGACSVLVRRLTLSTLRRMPARRWSRARAAVFVCPRARRRSLRLGSVCPSRDISARYLLCALPHRADSQLSQQRADLEQA